MKQSILKIAMMYSDHVGLTLSTVATYAADDGKLFKRLSGRSSCTLKTAETVLQWFSDHWPDAELSWPDDIPRPRKNRKAAA